MKARQGLLKLEKLGLTQEEVDEMLPVIGENLSDSGTFNSVLELLVASGRSIPEAVMMMIPEAWENNPNMHADRRGFYGGYPTGPVIF